MNKAVTLTLRIAFLVLVVYVMASIAGAAQGFSVNGPGDFRLAAGRKAKGGRNRMAGAVLTPQYRNAYTGMRSTLIASAGTDVPRVGIQSMVP